MKILDLENPQNFGLGLERETKFEEFIKTKTFIARWLWRSAEFLVNKIGYMPYVFFEKEDLDQKAIEKLQQHPELLDVIYQWIENNDKSLLDDLKKAKKVFEHIQQPKRRDKFLYRGFGISSGQIVHGLDRPTLFDMDIGDKFEDTPNKPVSFSAYEEVAKAYGNIIVTVDYASVNKRMLHITNEVLIATAMMVDRRNGLDEKAINQAYGINGHYFSAIGLSASQGRYFSYFESVFLPDDKPLEFTLFKKADNANVTNSNYHR